VQIDLVELSLVEYYQPGEAKPSGVLVQINLVDSSDNTIITSVRKDKDNCARGMHKRIYSYCNNLTTSLIITDRAGYI
jgi:hypothetical protein